MNTLFRALRNQRGAALPVALAGLVGVSLLVTTALLTSSTESAISSAQASSTRSLYDAESAANEYLRANGGILTGLPTTPQTVTVPGSTARVRITAARLRYAAAAGGGWTATYAVTAEPLGPNGNPRGRAVVSMIRQTRPDPAPLNTNITSAITLGGDLDVNGNSFTVNGRFSGCGVTGGVDAVRSASDSEIRTNNERHMDNFLGYSNGTNTSGRSAIDKSTLSREDLARNVLGGKSIEELIATVPQNRKWGPRFGRPAWDGTLVNDSSGAPEEVAVVDANGGTIEVLGGTGVLIVLRGNVRMRGNATFNGIIITEGNFNLSGNPQVTGALISLAMEGTNSIDQDDSAIANGNITVQFNKCAITAAQQAFGRQAGNQPPAFGSGTFAWFEVVR